MEESKCDLKSNEGACSHLILMLKVKTGATQFDCVCEEETCAGCIKDGWCPLYVTRMEMIKKYGNYLFNTCAKCANKTCTKSVTEIESCMEEDKEELKKSCNESDAHISYCEQMRDLGDPAYQEETLSIKNRLCPILSKPTGPRGHEWDNSEPAQCDTSKCPVKECPYDYCQNIRTRNATCYVSGGTPSDIKDYYCSLGNAVSDDRCKRKDKPCQYREDLKETWYHV